MSKQAWRHARGVLAPHAGAAVARRAGGVGPGGRLQLGLDRLVGGCVRTGAARRRAVSSEAASRARGSGEGRRGCAVGPRALHSALWCRRLIFGVESIVESLC